MPSYKSRSKITNLLKFKKDVSASTYLSAAIYASLMNLRDYVERQDFKGYDPYDALNSPLLRGLCLNKKNTRMAFIQSLKRLPFNLRPLLGIKRGYNPKGIGLFLWGYTKLFALEKKPEYLEKINFLIELLEESKSAGYSGYCWGYNFDWQSRSFYLPKYTPTVVNSSFIGHALIDTYKYTNINRALEIAVSIKNFILNDLNRRKENIFFCFSYSPIDEVYVHNANLLGASLLIRLFKYTGENLLKDTALSSLGYSMKYQRPDGSWPYAETEYQNWIDSFHTGFNLQSILYFLEAGFEEYRDAFERGVKFYQEKFLLDDGTSKYYHDKLYPVDIHSAVQALVFFSRCGRNYLNLAEKIANRTIENFQGKEGYFYFQKNRLFTNKISYMRWSQAWTFHAITEYLFSTRKVNQDVNTRRA